MEIIPNDQEEKEFIFKKNADFAPSIIDNFYTFIPDVKRSCTVKEDNKISNKGNSSDNENEDFSFKNLNSLFELDINDEDLSFSNYNEWGPKAGTDLILNPKVQLYLPTDNNYEISGKTLSNGYNKNDKLIYKKVSRGISNCLLLYLNKYYQKAPYHKFYKHNLYNRPILIKDQNYQCYICHKKFLFVSDIPLEPIFWCSYYMRYVCKDCIDEEFTIIPYFIFEKWCFEKFPISKKAKNSLQKWYNKPIIYFQNNDILLKKISQLHKILEIKKIINYIFDIMKCENKFKFVEEQFGEYEYLLLKEYLFSMKDLVEIHNKTFLQRLNYFKNILVRHISGECDRCKYEGDICARCRSNQKIFFYDTDNVFHCKKCRKSYHKKCLGFVEHVH